MSATIPAHRRIQDLVTLVNDFLPDGYYLGYELIHTDVPEADRIRADHEMKARWRSRLARHGKPGADDDIAALPADAASVAETHVLFEILHIPTGIQAVRTVPMDTLVALADEYQSANANRKTQIRNAVKNQLQNFYALCEARVTAEDSP